MTNKPKRPKVKQPMSENNDELADLEKVGEWEREQMKIFRPIVDSRVAALNTALNSYGPEDFPPEIVFLAARRLAEDLEAIHEVLNGRDLYLQALRTARVCRKTIGDDRPTAGRAQR